MPTLRNFETGNFDTRQPSLFANRSSSRASVDADGKGGSIADGKGMVVADGKGEEGMTSDERARTSRSISSASRRRVTGSLINNNDDGEDGNDDDENDNDNDNDGASSSSRSRRTTDTAGRGACEDRSLMGAVISDDEVTAGGPGWTFPHLINGNCPLTMGIVRFSDEGSPLGSVNF
jgi:hypothetical protein